MDRVEVVQRALDATGGGTYLEIGVERGLSFIPIQAERKIAVDPRFLVPKRAMYNMGWIWGLLTGRGELYFQMTSDEFFASHAEELLGKEGIDVAFIDGLHTFHQSLNDVRNCLMYLKPQGIIVMHDCNPTTPSMAYPGRSFDQVDSLSLPGWTREWCGDVWKTVAHLRATRSDLEVQVLECDYGVGLIRKGPPINRFSPPPGRIESMTYEELERGRPTILNLTPPASLASFLKREGTTTQYRFTA